MERLIVLIFSSVILASVVWLVRSPQAQTVEAIGAVTVTFPTSPLFQILNWLPGDTAQKTFSVKNNGGDIFRLAIRAVEKENLGNLKEVVGVVIEDNNNEIWYGDVPVTLAGWYGEPYVLLGNVNPGQTRLFTIKVNFPSEVGNEFQKSKAVFDIVVMKELFGPDGQPIPDQCLALGGATIIGTTGNDRIYGNLRNNLIYGLSGDDKIYGEGGHDCIIGGAGKDTITGGTGKDYIWGDDGEDDINGGSDEDNIWGGAGNDKLDGGSDPDKIWGESGDDKLEGGSGDDLIWAGDGIDIVDGGSGGDTVHGDKGNDSLLGGSGDDYLNGDGDNDSVDGYTGKDTCIAELKNGCEF